MFQQILYFAHYVILLLFGIGLSFLFSKISISKKNALVSFSFSATCILFQLLAYILLGDELTWKIYPLFVHLPVLLLLCYYYQKRFTTVCVAIATAYLCCQPANLMGKLAFQIFRSSSTEYMVRIVSLVITMYFVARYFAPHLSEILNRDNRRIITFGILPVGYYFYDYLLGVYTDFWFNHNPVARELLPTFLFFVFMIIGITYYREYVVREQLEAKEQIIETSLEQQKKELNSLKQASHEIHLLRHDMRLILNNVAACLENNDTAKALEIISGFTDQVNRTVVRRYCQNETMNYIISAFASRYGNQQIPFSCDIVLEQMSLDETMVSSILSNALDNAYNAQLELPEEKRIVKLMIKTSNNKLLISIKNTFANPPRFVDGMPVSHRRGHGYGTQSIQFMTERLGGNCQFSIQDEYFVVRIVI